MKEASTLSHDPATTAADAAPRLTAAVLEGISPVKRGAAAPIPEMADALRLKVAAETAHDAAQRAENQARRALDEAVRLVARTGQDLKAACGVYDAAIRQHRRRQIDPAARPPAA
jgi:hypothetical protein